MTEKIIAVDHLNIAVKKGELFGLLGPNGAGKTTTIKMLCTLLAPTSGTAEVAGYDIIEEETKVKEKVGIAPEMGPRSLYWKLTGKENLEYFAALYGVSGHEAAGRIKFLLEMVGLTDRENDLVERYSLGMKQRLVLAKALINDPQVLLLDEPTLGLDPNIATSIRLLIKRRFSRKLGKTAILTTHNMHEAEQLCDRIAIINKGKLVAVGTPKNLINLIKHKEVYEIRILNFNKKIKESLEGVEGVVSIETISHDEIENATTIRVSLEKKKLDAIPTTMEVVKRYRGKVVYFETVGPTLEEAFMELTKG